MKSNYQKNLETLKKAGEDLKLSNSELIKRVEKCIQELPEAIFKDKWECPTNQEKNKD